MKRPGLSKACIVDEHVYLVPGCLDAFRKTPFHNVRANRLTRIMAAARTKKARAEDGVAS